MAHSRAVEAFVEKPDAATAANYVAERYLWNSGNFLFHAATMLGEIERFEPAMAEAAKAAVAGLTRDLDFLRLASEPFAHVPKKSIDYAVMQRTRRSASKISIATRSKPFLSAELCWSRSSGILRTRSAGSSRISGSSSARQR